MYISCDSLLMLASSYYSFVAWQHINMVLLFSAGKKDDTMFKNNLSPLPLLRELEAMYLERRLKQRKRLPLLQTTVLWLYLQATLSPNSTNMVMTGCDVLLIKNKCVGEKAERTGRWWNRKVMYEWLKCNSFNLNSHLYSYIHYFSGLNNWFSYLYTFNVYVL